MITITPASIQATSVGPTFALLNIVPGKSQPISTSPSTLNVPWHDLPENPSLFSLLSWHTAVSPFVGRDGEMDELRGWAYGPQAISIKFVVGPGGVGKSRLGAEFAQELQSQDWAAGFVKLDKPEAFIAHENGTLLVIDYPEEHPGGVEEMLSDLAAMPAKGRLRVLFLTRQQISDWASVIEDTRSESIVDMAPIFLGGLDVSESQEVYHAVSEKTGEILDTDWEPLSHDAMEDWLQTAPENDRVLFVMAAGLHNALKPEDSVVKDQGRESVKLLVKREMTRIHALARSCGEDDKYVFARLLAVATIAGSLSANQIGRLIECYGKSCRFPSRSNAMDEMKKAGFMFGTEVEALKPDIVAASFVMDVLGQAPESAPELIWAALECDLENGVYRFSRLAYDAEYVLMEDEHRLSLWLARALEGNADRARKIVSVMSIKNLPITLFYGAIAVYQAILPFCESDKSDKVKPRILNNLSVNLAGTGKKTEALEACRQAVEIYERLSSQNPAAYEPDLATSLNNLGNRYSDLGQRTEALEACRRAVEIYERLSSQNPATYEPVLAMNLNNLGKFYSELGQRTEALEACRRAVEIYQRLSSQNPAAYEPDLATSLNNLGKFYSALEQRTEALEACRRAVEIRERLSSQNPAAYEPVLADSLNNLGIRHFELGQRTEALEAGRRTVEIRERLSSQNPAAYEPDLADSLNNLCAFYTELGQRTEALEACRRAVEIRERLSSQNPAAYEPDLAMSFGALASIFLNFGQNIEAAETFKRGITTLMPNFSKLPESFRGLMSALLNGYVTSCEQAGIEPDPLLQDSIMKILS